MSKTVLVRREQHSIEAFLRDAKDKVGAGIEAAQNGVSKIFAGGVSLTVTFLSVGFGNAEAQVTVPGENGANVQHGGVIVVPPANYGPMGGGVQVPNYGPTGGVHVPGSTGGVTIVTPNGTVINPEPNTASSVVLNGTNATAHILQTATNHAVASPSFELGVIFGALALGSAAVYLSARTILRRRRARGSDATRNSKGTDWRPIGEDIPEDHK
ncbi:MAG: hypothetical protein KGH98_03350 [Candidatus Micrarchaeota archaeon]|nr:hypothetical protein [Candidatus Micrarchaeota archaeon]